MFYGGCAHIALSTNNLLLYVAVLNLLRAEETVVFLGVNWPHEPERPTESPIDHRTDLRIDSGKSNCRNNHRCRPLANLIREV